MNIHTLFILLAVSAIPILHAKSLKIEQVSATGEHVTLATVPSLTGMGETVVRSTQEYSCFVAVPKSGLRDGNSITEYKVIPVWTGLVIKAKLASDNMVSIDIERNSFAGMDGDIPKIVKEHYANTVPVGRPTGSLFAGFGDLLLTLTD